MHLKRRDIAAVVAFLAVLCMTGAASAMPATAQAIRPLGAQDVSHPDSKGANPNTPCPLGGGVTWQSIARPSYALSNSAWSTKNSAPILTWKWLDQQNQCFYDFQLSNGNWVEELAFDPNGDRGLSGQCMEDPNWRYNAGVDQYSCTYYYQLNEQWAEQRSSALCTFGPDFWSLENQGDDQYIYFNVPNGQALLRDYDSSTLQECWG